MRQYLDLVDSILTEGVQKGDRTGTGTHSLHNVHIKHNMKNGFPLLTTKNIPFRLIASENEFFIKGITDKKWLQERNNHIWDEWCTPEKVAYGHNEQIKAKMLAERDLGPIYGFQWRHFGANYCGYDMDYTGQGVDQLKNLVSRLKTNPECRRMLVTALNPVDQSKMALPPCHYVFHVLTRPGNTLEDKRILDLSWKQRSVDTMLGLPFNIAGYGLILHLLAKETGMEEGVLTGDLGDTHIYSNHLEGAKEQLRRIPTELPQIVTDSFTTIFDWNYTDSKVEGYNPQGRIKFPIAV